MSYYNTTTIVYHLLIVKIVIFFKFFEVKRFLCLFKVSPAFENNLSLGTEVATGIRYFKAIPVNMGYTLDISFHICKGSSDNLA